MSCESLATSRTHTDASLRRYIQQSSKSVRELAAELGVAESTIRRWRQRQDVRDRPRAARNLRTTLSRQQEWWVICLRQITRLPLDELLWLTRAALNPGASRSGLDRCLRRHGITPLGRHELPPARKLGCYDWWQIALPGSDQALYVAVEQQSRWMHAELRTNHPRTRSAFLSRLQRRAPVLMSHCQRQPDPGTPAGDSLDSSQLAVQRQLLARLLWLYNHRLSMNQLAEMTPHGYLRQLHLLQPWAFRAQPIAARAPEVEQQPPQPAQRSQRLAQLEPA